MIADKDYCGTIVLEINGKEYEIKSFDHEEKNSRQLVKTMNSKKRPLGSTCGSLEHDIKIEAYIPLDDSEPRWTNMTNATLTIYPACGTGGKREIFTGVFVQSVGSKYDVDNAAVRSISAQALDHQFL